MNKDVELSDAFVAYASFRPQQGLPIMNGKESVYEKQLRQRKFPSPTGVTYYESMKSKKQKMGLSCFRPQQGLPIMNDK